MSALSGTEYLLVQAQQSDYLWGFYDVRDFRSPPCRTPSVGKSNNFAKETIQRFLFVAFSLLQLLAGNN
jgi:hypothetical protein